MKPFIDFYNSKKIIPVSQNIDDDNFFARRNYLYTTLGIPIRQLQGKRIIEFGPGGGYNATATSRFEPELYVFVDASEASLDILRKRNLSVRNVEIYKSEISDYRDGRKYDLVICEGVLPCQTDPAEMLRHVASFSDGIVTATTMTATSLLSEVCRRILRPSIKGSFEKQTETCVELFRSHFGNIQTTKRPIDDWVHDMILHDWHKGQYIFTMEDAARALPDFDFYGSSPRFLTDGRWYKKVESTSILTTLLKKQYSSFNTYLLDPRVPLALVIESKNYSWAIDELCEVLCSMHCDIIDEDSYDKLDSFLKVLDELMGILPYEFNVTKKSIVDFMIGIRKFADGDMSTDFGSFAHWWGMGQQYISFIKV